MSLENKESSKNSVILSISESIDSKKIEKNENKIKELNKKLDENSEPIIINIGENSFNIEKPNENKNDIKNKKETKIVKTDSLDFVFDPLPKTEGQKEKEERHEISDLDNEKHMKTIESKVNRKYNPKSSYEILFGSHLRSTVNDRSPKNEEKLPIPDIPLNDDLSKMTDSKPPVVDKRHVIEVNRISDGITEWMTKTVNKSKKKNKEIEWKNGLENIAKLRKFYIYDRIRQIDRLYNREFTTNCMTIRNADFQQLFYVGVEANRGNSTYRSFNLRFVDQYSRHVMSVKKKCKSICGLLSIDIECPPRALIGHMKQNRFFFKSTVEFIISEPKTNKKLFTIRRSAEKLVKHEFDVINAMNEKIGNITKRFEELVLNKTIREDRCVRLTVTSMISAIDKALLLSAALILNIFYLRKFEKSEEQV